MRDIVVNDWPGLDAETIGILRANLMYSLKSFLGMSARKEYRQLLLDAGLTETRIRAMRKEARRLLDALPEVTVRGVLEGYVETGTEGYEWAVYEDGKRGYEGLHLIEQGDYLRVCDENGEVRFEGFIRQDFKAGWMEYPLNPGYGQPSALGLWIHWTQKGWTPDDWAALFMRPYLRDERKGPPLRAELTMNRKKPRKGADPRYADGRPPRKRR